MGEKQKRVRRGLKTPDVSGPETGLTRMLSGSYNYRKMPQELRDLITPTQLAYYRNAGKLPNSRQVGRQWFYTAADLAALPYLAVRGYYSF